MLSEPQIKGILSALSQALKSGGHDNCKYTDVYRTALDVRKSIAPHSDGVWPDNVIKKAPSESTVEFQWKKDTYEPETMGYWSDATDQCGRHWNKQNWQFIADAESELPDYLKDLPELGNFWDWSLNQLHPMRCNDPNAVVAVDPNMIRREDGEVDTTELPAPVPKFYDTSSACIFVRDTFFLGKSKETIKLGPNQEGLVYHLYDSAHIYEVRQIGKRQDWQFEAKLIYNHGADRLPAWKLGGKIVPNTDYSLYESVFQGAIPKLNRCLKDAVSLSVLKPKFAHPIYEYITHPCTNDACENGVIEVEGDGEAKTEPCPTCDGGKRNLISWGKDLTHDSEAMMAGEGKLPFPGLHTHSPSTETLKFTDEQIDKAAFMAFALLNVKLTTKPTGTTATEVAISDAGRKAFSIGIASAEFALAGDIANTIGAMRYMSKHKPCKLSFNNDFEIKTAAELSEELADLKQKGATKMVLDSVESSFTEQRLHSDAMHIALLKLLQKIDPMHHMTPAEVATASAVSGGFSPTDVWVHYNAERFILEKVAESEAYLDKGATEIRTELIVEAKERLAEVAATANAQILANANA